MESLQSEIRTVSRSSVSRSAIDELANPYFLHHSVSDSSTHNFQNSSSSKLHNSQQSGIGRFIQSLNPNQYHQLMSMLSNHLTSSSNPTDRHKYNATSYAVGTCFSLSEHSIFSSNNIWIVDSGATRHICSHAGAFISMRIIENSTVTLPNLTQIPVRLCGNVRLSSNLVPQDVLFVPQFKFNLLSVSALTYGSKLTVSFFPDHFII